MILIRLSECQHTYTSDYCDGDYSGPAAGVASLEEVLVDVLEDEERSGSTSQSITEEQDDASARQSPKRARRRTA